MELILNSYESNAGILTLTQVLDFAILIMIQINFNFKVVGSMKTLRVAVQLAE